MALLPSVDIRPIEGKHARLYGSLVCVKDNLPHLGWFKQYLLRDNWETIQVLYKSRFGLHY